MPRFTSVERLPSFMGTGNMGEVRFAGQGSKDLDMMCGDGTESL